MDPDQLASPSRSGSTLEGFHLLKLIYKLTENSVDPDQLTYVKPAKLDDTLFSKTGYNLLGYKVGHERIKD